MKQTFNAEVDYYKSIRSTNPQKLLLTDIFLGIKKGGSIKDLILKIRSTKDKKEQTKLKEKLGVVTFNATFSPTKKAEDFLSHNGLLIADFDGYNTAEELSKERKRLEADKYTLLCFLSPSGKGLKVLIKIPKTNPERHKYYFEEYGKYINSKHWDSTSQNVNRLCFISYDPDAFINQKSTLFKPDNEKPKTLKNSIKFYRELIQNRNVNKWEYFNKIAILVGGFSVTNSLDCDSYEALNELIQGARDNASVIDQNIAEKQIRNGFNYGTTMPLIPTDENLKTANESKPIKKKKIKHLLFRIGNDFYKSIRVPDKNGVLKSKIITIKRQTIVDDYGVKAIKKLKKYDAGVNVPNYINYQSEINNCYNWFRPFTHTPTEGDFPTITKLMNHIFGDQIEMGYDYIQLLYKNPVQNIPIIVLVSTENHTGKTTFIDFLQNVFGENMAIISTADIEGGFNQHFITKHIIAIDESDLHKQNTTAKIKQMATQKTAMKKGKFQDEISIDYFGRLIILSNNERSFINIKDEDIRYWVRKVHEIEEYDPDFEKKLKNEIPAFMYFIYHREMFYKKPKSRTWFAEKDFITKWAKNAKDENKSEMYFDLYDRLEDYFNENDDDLYLRSIDIKNKFYSFDTKKSIKWIAKSIRDEFKIESSMKKIKNDRGFYVVGRYFLFKKSMFLDEIDEKTVTQSFF